MASQADDSSVEDNVSSVGDSTWDILDDASIATSDDEERHLPRQPTPSTGEHETEEEQTDNFQHVGAVNKSRTESMHSSSILIGTPQDSRSTTEESCVSSPNTHTAEDSEDEEDLESTNRGLIPQSEPQSRCLKFNEPWPPQGNNPESAEGLCLWKRFDEEEIDQISQDFGLDLQASDAILVGTIRQKMARHSVRPRRPYKVLYVGPQSVKEPVVQKIGSALASSLNLTSGGAEAGSSRFTVVPISSFGDDSSPDVLLVNSLGLDISVEECTATRTGTPDASKESINIQLNDHKWIGSEWDQIRNKYILTKDYVLPDVAIIHLPEKETMLAKQTRLFARSFLSRHKVPMIVLSSRSPWKGPIQTMALDLRTPHFCLENWIPGQSDRRVLKRMPIDVAAFLDIDANQLGRSLTSLASTASRGDLAGSDTPGAQNPKPKIEMDRVTEWSAEGVRFLSKKKHLTRAATLSLVSILLYSMTMYFIPEPLFQLTRYLEPVGRMPPTYVTLSAPTVTSRVSSTSVSTTISSSSLKTSTISSLAHTPSTSPVKKNTELASFLLDSSLALNKSDKFKMHVIGDCHVVLRPPRWFTMLKKAPALLFKITRHDRPVGYEFSTVFDGVYALKVPREDAHGILNISVWTVKKPIINETFQIDFGTPWLKVAGWKKAAQVISDQFRGELQMAQTGISIAYEHTSVGVQSFMRDTVRKTDLALKEVEKVGIISLNQTSKTTGIMVSQSRELSRKLSRQLRSRKSKVSRKLYAQRQALRNDIHNYTRKMSSLLLQQARDLTEAATGLNVVNLANEVQEYREKHLRKTQKKALHMWWKVYGPPPKREKATAGKGKKCRKGRSKKCGNR